MHLVFATSIVPDGACASGYEIANAVILDALRRAGVRVSVLGFTWPGKMPADLENTIVLDSLDVRTAEAGTGRKLAWLAEALRARTTFSSAKLRIVDAHAVRSALANLEPVDGYVVNSVQLAGAFEEVFREKPSIYVAHNVEHLSAAESAAAAHGFAERRLLERESRLLKALEERLCDNARFVFTLCEEDRRILVNGDDARSAALPLVTRAVPHARQGERETRYDAALVGTWTWAPNRIGLEWFLKKVAPLLGGDFTIAVAGSTPKGMAEAYPRAAFVGRVPDAVEFVRSGRVVPLVSRAGTGVQLKTIETFEQGLPCVATTHSLRGIASVPDNCTVSDDPHVFAEALQAAAAKPVDVDGRGFMQAQKTALDRAIRDGLERFSGVPGREAA